MTQRPDTGDLVEATRSLFDAQLDLGQRLSVLAPDAVLENQSLGMTFQRVPAIRGFIEDWLGGYGEYQMEPQEIADLGNGVVFVAVRISGRPRGGAGGALQRTRPFVFIWADGAVAKVTTPSSSVEEARAAAQEVAEARR
jgi:hypothetical protein